MLEFYFVLLLPLPLSLMLTYLIAMGTQRRRKLEPIDVMPTLPPDSAPREAPSLLLGSCKTQTHMWNRIWHVTEFSSTINLYVAGVNVYPMHKPIDNSVLVEIIQ